MTSKEKNLLGLGILGVIAALIFGSDDKPAEPAMLSEELNSDKAETPERLSGVDQREAKDGRKPLNITAIKKEIEKRKPETFKGISEILAEYKVRYGLAWNNVYYMGAYQGVRIYIWDRNNVKHTIPGKTDSYRVKEDTRLPKIHVDSEGKEIKGKLSGKKSKRKLSGKKQSLKIIGTDASLTESRNQGYTMAEVPSTKFTKDTSMRVFAYYPDYIIEESGGTISKDAKVFDTEVTWNDLLEDYNKHKSSIDKFVGYEVVSKKTKPDYYELLNLADVINAYKGL